MKAPPANKNEAKTMWVVLLTAVTIFECADWAR